MPGRRTIAALGIAAAALLISSPASAMVWTWWLGAGGGVRHVSADSAQAVFAPRAGLSLMPTWGTNSPFHLLLVGPWLGIESQLDGVLAEGGIELTIAPIYDGDMMYGFRLGGGAGSDSNGRAPLGSVTFLMGFRDVPESCDALTLAHGVRIYAAVRDALPRQGLTFLAGFEIEPSLLFPPYSRRAIVGRGNNGGCVVDE